MTIVSQLALVDNSVVFYPKAKEKAKAKGQDEVERGTGFQRIIR